MTSRVNRPCNREGCLPTQWCKWCVEIVRLEEQYEAMREALQGMVNEFRGELWEDDPIWLAAINALGQREAA